jgi:hypothetical protein
MRYAYIFLLCFLLFGFNMFAKELNPVNEDRLVVYEHSSKMFYLDKGKLVMEWRHRFERDYGFMRYIYNNKEYRRLSKSEVRQFDAMSKIKLQNRKIYFDGKKVKTNVLWVSAVHAAYYWSGGVLIVASTSKGYYSLDATDNEVGFLDLQTNKCRFIMTGTRNNSAPRIPDFLVPASIYLSNKDLVLDIKVPKTISLYETLPVTISITNVSNKPILIPDSLKENLGIASFFQESRSLSAKRQPGPLAPSEESSSLLMPSEKRESIALFAANQLRGGPGITHLVFYWDGFLNGRDRSEISRFICEKRVMFTDKPPFTINVSNTDLVFDVEIPEKIPRSVIFNCIISLTNVSDKPIWVPDSLSQGMAMFHSPPHDHGKFMDFDMSKDYFPDSQRNFPYICDVSMNSYSLLMPSEKRVTVMPFRERHFYWYPGRWGIAFYWEGFLNPFDKSVLTRFKCEKWIETTKKRTLR